MALDFIFENIKSFGGDPNQVSLMGHSAGALMTILHAKDKRIKSLIVASPPFLPWRSQQMVKDDFEKILEKTNCNDKACLAKKPMWELLEAYKSSRPLLEMNLIPFVDGSIITHHSLDFLKSKQFTATRVLAGNVQNETIRMVKQVFSKMDAANYRLLVNGLFSNSENILEAFPAKVDQNHDHRPMFSKLYDMQLFYCPMKVMKNSYLWETPWTGGTDSIGNPCGDGLTCHTTDINYLFNDPLDSELRKGSIALRQTISDFIRYGSNGTEKNIIITGSGNPLILNNQSLDCSLFNSPLIEHENGSTFKGLNSNMILISWYILISLMTIQIIMFIYNRFRFKEVTRTNTSYNELSTANLSGFADIVDAKPISVDLKVKDLNYSIEEKSILSSISFTCLPGSITALMGPSGSGKTTLMSLIAKRWNHRESQNNVFYADQKLADISDSLFKSVTAFVAQTDVPYYGLTPREVLILNAKLEFNSHPRLLSQKIAYFLLVMGLDSCQDVVIQRTGESGGLSGGQLRRLSIAVALLKSPGVLFLDEPTSGLDSKAAMEIIQVLVRLSNLGYTIICSIHQPRPEVFYLMNQTLILAHGTLIYSGPPTSALCCLSLATQTWSVRSENEADTILDIATSIPNDKIKQVASFSRKWVDDRFEIPSKKTMLTDYYHSKPSIFSQVGIVNLRWWSVRPLVRKFGLMFFTVLATIILSFMQRREEIDMIGLELQIKGLAIACIGLSALKNISISFDYYEDRDLFNFDSKNGSIHPLAFYIHRIIYETSTASFESIVCSIIAYCILNCQQAIPTARSVILLMVAYYNCIVSMYTLIYCSPIGRPEARSVSFFLQALISVTSGIWIPQASDTKFYGMVSWVKYANPNYWVLSPMIQAILYRTGPCQLNYPDGSCAIYLGDAVLEQTRIEQISVETSIVMLILVWVTVRSMQLFLLYRDIPFKLRK